MNKVLKSFILCLLLFPATTWGQSHLVPGTAVEEPLKKHHHDRPVNFGIKGGFTSSLFLVLFTVGEVSYYWNVCVRMIPQFCLKDCTPVISSQILY